MIHLFINLQKRSFCLLQNKILIELCGTFEACQLALLAVLCMGINRICKMVPPLLYQVFCWWHRIATTKVLKAIYLNMLSWFAYCIVFASLSTVIGCRLPISTFFKQNLDWPYKWHQWANKSYHIIKFGIYGKWTLKQNQVIKKRRKRTGRIIDNFFRLSFNSRMIRCERWAQADFTSPVGWIKSENQRHGQFGLGTLHFVFNHLFLHSKLGQKKASALSISLALTFAKSVDVGFANDSQTHLTSKYFGVSKNTKKCQQVPGQ